MKNMMMLIGLIITATAYGFQEVHEFVLNDGSTFEGIVVSCNSASDTVELLSPDGDEIISDFSMFSSENQAYLKQWEQCELFMSPTRFVVIPTHSMDRQWVGQPVGESGDGEGLFVSGVSEHRYYLAMYNLGSTALENVTVDYHIVYSETFSPAEADRLALLSPSMSGDEGFVTISQGIEGSIPVARLEVGGWKQFVTRPVTLVDGDDAPASNRIQITVSMEAPDGTLLSREIELPDTSYSGDA
ncbi:hypothetical protein P4E94_18065 [Pontiellaceae bacterium B12219]|nr:hypothetical protein [Pontiellaceae bacterium B12219]